MPERFTRRQFLSLAATLIGIPSLTACNNSSSQQEGLRPAPSTVRPAETYSITLDQFYQLYYPELGATSPSEKGTFLTAGGRDVKWYNFTTEFVFNPDALKQLYEYYEKKAQEMIQGDVVDTNGLITHYQMIPNPYKKIGVFFVGNNTPNPNWVQKNLKSFGAETKYSYDDGSPNLTVIKATNPSSIPRPIGDFFITVEDTANDAIFIEAAQAIFAAVAETGGAPAANRVQEVFANSYGHSLYFKQHGLSWSEYQKRTATIGYPFPEGPTLRFIQLNETQYKDLPSLPLIIKR